MKAVALRLSCILMIIIDFDYFIEGSSFTGFLKPGQCNVHFSYVRMCKPKEIRRKQIKLAPLLIELKDDPGRDTMVAVNLTAPEDSGPIGMEIGLTVFVGKIKDKVPTIKMPNICIEKFSQRQLVKYLNVTKNCIVPKGTYIFDLNASKMIEDIIGDKYLVATALFQLWFMVKTSTAICVKGEVVVTKKN